jgi:hypothetical protein
VSRIAMLHDWTLHPTISTEWTTDVAASSETLAEERRGLVGRPRRTLLLRWRSLSRAEANRLLFALMRACDPELDGDDQPIPLDVPVYPDVAATTASSSGVTIHCPTANRRFHVGQRVVIQMLSGGRAVSAEARTIGAVAADSVTVTAALDGTYPRGSLAYPAIRARTLLEAELVAQTDQAVDVQVAFSEVLEEALPTLCEYADLGADHDYGTADDGAGNLYYVLDLAPEWRAAPTVRVVRSGRVEQIGRDETTLARGPRPQLSIAFTYLAMSRSEHFRALAFFDAHRGRLIPFFVANPVTAWEAEAIAVGYVDVPQDGELEDVQAYADFVAVEVDGELHVRPIASITVQGDSWRIAVSIDFPAIALADIARVTLAHLCRFATDALDEDWTTSGVATTRLAVVELLNEKAAGATDATWSDPACEV